jgi:REP element-mobilizing transposase RayT
MATHWLFTWTTYGSRLPGDQRGTTTTMRDGAGRRRAFNAPGDRFAAPAPALETWTAGILRERPVFLTRAAADIVLRQVVRTADYQRWDLIAAAVMADHVHLVVDLGAEVDRAGAIDAMRRFKAYASRALNLEVSRRERWWTRGGSRRMLMRDEAIAAAIHYVASQRACLALTVRPPWGEIARDREVGR